MASGTRGGKRRRHRQPALDAEKLAAIKDYLQRGWSKRRISIQLNIPRCTLYRAIDGVGPYQGIEL